MKRFFSLNPWLLAANANAQLAVAVSPVKLTGQRAMVPLEMKNNLDEKVQSARAAESQDCGKGWKSK